MPNTLSNYQRIVFFLVLAFIFIVGFLNLDSLTIRRLDEGRNAVNAIEMFLSGNYLFTTYENMIDLWNTKPPLLIWLQAGFMHFIGPGVLAIRLPGALLGIGLAVIIYLFSKNTIQSVWLGLISVICLFSIDGFTGIHALRTGDFDVPLTFFLSGFLFLFYKFLNSGIAKHIYIANIFLALALLTKGVAALLFLPGLFFFLLADNKLLYVLKSKAVWISSLIPAGLISSYYLMRHLVTPGYLGNVWNNELFGRYMEVNEGNTGSTLYYLEILIGPDFGIPLLALAVLALPLSFYFNRYKNITIYLQTLVTFHILILSLSKTKLAWYIIPSYPLLALLVAISLCILLEIIKLKLKEPAYLAVIILVFGVNIFKTVKNRALAIEPKQEMYEFAYLMKSAVEENNNFDNSYTFVDLESYRADYIFYAHILGQKIDFKNYNEISSSSTEKLVTWIDEIKGNIHSYNTVNSVKEDGKLSYFFIEGLDSSSLAYRLENYDSSKKITLKNDMVILPNKTHRNRVLLIQRHTVGDQPKADYYNFRFNCSYEFDYFRGHESLRFNTWDYEDHDGYALKFIQLKGKPFELEYSQSDKNWNIIWKDFSNLNW